MSRQVSINIELFRANVEALKARLSSLNSGIKKNTTLSNTNISPFTDDLESVVKAVELLEKYKQLMDADIETLRQTGESMKEQDEQLAQYRCSDTGLEPVETKRK